MDNADKSEEQLPGNSNLPNLDILKNQFNEIIEVIGILDKVISLKMNPETSDSNKFLENDQNLDDRDKRMEKTSTKSHSGTINEKGGLSNILSSDNCSNTEASGICSDNLEADNNDCTSSKAEKLDLNILVDDAETTCSKSQTSEPRSDYSIISQESDSSSQSSSSDGTETSTSTIRCSDDGSEVSESAEDDDESSDCNSEVSDNAEKISDNNSNTTSSSTILDHHSEITATTTTKGSCTGQINVDGDSTDINTIILSNTAKYLHFSSSESDSSSSKDSDSESHPSTPTFSESNAGPLYQSDLGFSNIAQKLYSWKPSNTFERAILNITQELRSLIRSNNLAIDETGTVTIEESSDIEPNLSRSERIEFLKNELQRLMQRSDELSDCATNSTTTDDSPTLTKDQESSTSSDESTDTELETIGDLVKAIVKLHPIKNELQRSKQSSDELSDSATNSTTTDDSPTLTKDQKSSTSSDESTDTEFETIGDLFKTIVKLHPIKKFEIPPFEYTKAERTLGTARGELDNSSTNQATNIMQSEENGEHQEIPLNSFFNVDSHSVMTFEIQNSLSLNGSLICDFLIKEYLNSTTKLIFLLLREIKGISAEDYESRMEAVLSLDDELGYLSAKLITTANDWTKQLQEIKRNLQTDAQSATRSRELYYMSVLRICIRLTEILLDFNLGNQLRLEEYERALISYKNRST